MSEEFGFGPRWAWGGTCCGKPVGCTNMSGQCRMLNHPWKRWHREEFDEDTGAGTPTEERKVSNTECSRFESEAAYHDNL